MLSADEQLIRDVVRFDAHHSNSVATCSILGLVEDFASLRIVDPKLTLSTHVEMELGGQTAPLASRQNSESSARGKTSNLTALLAGAHSSILGRHSTSTMNGHEARRALNRVLREQGLTTVSVVPVSLLLFEKRKAYEAARGDDGELRVLLHKLLQRSLVLGEALGAAAELTKERWCESVLPKPGTVLEIVLNNVLCRAGITAQIALELTGVNKSNVYRAIDVLEGKDILREVTGRKKDQIWLATSYIDVLAAAG